MSENIDDYLLTGAQTLDASNDIPTIVVFPYTSVLERGEGDSWRTRLSLPSEMAVRGAVEIMNSHPGSSLVMPGETSYSLDGCLSTTDLMMQMAEPLAYDREVLIPLDKLERNGRPLDNTYLQVRAFSEFLKKNGTNPNEIVGVAFSAHLERVMSIMQAYHINARYVSVEEILPAANIHIYDKYLPAMAELEITERMKRLIGSNKGRLLNLITYVRGPGYLDIVEAEKGGYKLDDRFARSRQRELMRELDAASLETD